MKRTLTALGIIAGIALIVFLGYFLRFRGEGEVPPIEEPGRSDGLPLPPLGSGGVAPLPQTNGTGTPAGLPTGRVFGSVSDAPIDSFFVDARGGILFVQTDGQVMQIIGGKTEALSTGSIENLSRSSFSSDGRRILVRLSAPENGEQWSLFDVEKRTWEVLPQGARAATWAPSGSRFAYVRDAGANRQELVVQDAAALKTAPQVITRIAWADPQLSWPAADDIIISEPSSVLTQSSIIRVGIKAKSARVIARDQRGARAVWDGTMQRGLLFTAPAQKRGGILSIVNGEGTAVDRLSFITLPEKCLFGTTAPSTASSTGAAGTSTVVGTATSSVATSTPFLLCAVGRDPAVLQLAALPDAYDKQTLSASDDFYRIDLTTGEATLLPGTTGETIDANAPAIVGGTLFFLNRIDRKLYALSLPASS